MRCLALALILCSLAAFANAGCYMGPKRGGAQEPCQDDTDKDWHEVGSSWTNSKCMECSCKATAMDCCDRMGRPSGFPEDCEVLRDWKECTFVVVKKNDHSVHCPHAAVGK